MNKSIKLHFYRSGSGERNFGDELSPMIVEMVSGKKVELASVSNCEMISLGSIFDGVIKKLWKRKFMLNFDPIHVWGTGFIDDNKVYDKKLFHKTFNVHAVRGKFSERVTGLKNLTYGDPGLLSRYLVKKQEKKIKTLIIPHLAHRGLPDIKQFINSIDNCKVADLSGDPLEVLKQISSAEQIISTSLHGLICADSFGIPNIRLTTSQDLKGGDFKFNDYNSSISRDTEIVNTTNSFDDTIKALESSDFNYQNNIDNLCESLINNFPSHLK